MTERLIFLAADFLARLFIRRLENLRESGNHERLRRLEDFLDKRPAGFALTGRDSSGDLS